MSQNYIQEHVYLIAQHEQEFLDSRTKTERMGDNVAGFVGSLSFASTHLVLFLTWILFNTLSITLPHHFDSAPFSLLGTIVALEAIILASLILMKQARVSRRSEERDHLMLQILLLTEKEVTTVLSMGRQIAGKVGLEKAANSQEAKDLSQKTSIDDLAQTIKQNLPSTES